MLAQFVAQYHGELFTAIQAAVISYGIYSYVLYPLYFHPLAAIPGPRICALTKYWILFVSWSENRNRYVHQLHKKYGPIVRIGPEEIDISDPDYLKDIYINNFDKTSFYTQFANFGSFNTFSTIEKKTHRDSRKVSAKLYSKSNVVSEPFQAKIRTVMSTLLKVLEQNQDKRLNTFHLWSVMAMDTITSFSFGNKVCKSLLDDFFGEGETVIKAFMTQSSSWFWTTQMPQLYDWVVPSYVAKASKIACDWINSQFSECLEKDPGNTNTLVGVLMGTNGEKLFDARRARSEVFDHVAAGHNTTGTTLSYFFYELARDPEKQQRLRAELAGLNGGNIATTNYQSLLYSDVEELPYLSALTQEVFRIYAAIPGQEPRRAPKGGFRWRGSKETPSTYIPEGTVVVMQPWSLHRDPTVFEQPEVFIPDRWLVDDEQKLKSMNRQMMQFGSGSRMCLGLHIATCEIKLCVSNVISRYEVSLVDGYDYEVNAQMKDIYTTIPRSGDMPLKFRALAV
ncbi:hypothetical protein KL919_001658 [Ogataea angusta]|nr:hypothetical protein KL919_001658 [Ogataea angusta]